MLRTGGLSRWIGGNLAVSEKPLFQAVEVRAVRLALGTDAWVLIQGRNWDGIDSLDGSGWVWCSSVANTHPVEIP